MPTNQFKAFATDVGANVASQATYDAAPEKGAGMQTGTADSALCNKVWRQGAFIAAVVAQMIVDNLGVDMLDDGDVPAKVTLLTNAILDITSIYAPINSPTFTGVPLAPTPATPDNSQKIATTAFVVAKLLAYATIASPAFTGSPTAPNPPSHDNSTRIATTAWAIAELLAYAPLASPALTGAPTAPTPAPGDNTTKIATTAFIVAALAAYATLASPNFTGTPLAPTPAPGDNSQKIATTAFIVLALAGYAPLASPTFTGTPLSTTPPLGDNSKKIATTDWWWGTSPFTKRYANPAFAYTNGTNQGPFNHGLGYQPSVAIIRMTCTSAELGYAVNDKVTVIMGMGDDGTGFTMFNQSNTQFSLAISANGISVINKGTHGRGVITPGDWSMTLEAF